MSKLYSNCSPLDPALFSRQIESLALAHINQSDSCHQQRITTGKTGVVVGVSVSGKASSYVATALLFARPCPYLIQIDSLALALHQSNSYHQQGTTTGKTGVWG